MKNLYKFLRVIAIVAVIGFTLVGCGDGNDDTGGNSGGNNTGGSNNSVLSGTYGGQGDYDGIIVTFSGSNYTINADGYEYERGSYSITGNTVRFTPTWNDNNGLTSYTGTLSGSNNSNLTVQGITLSKGTNNGGGGGGGGTTTVPSAPTGVTATAQSSSSISVTWGSVSGATSYKVYYATSSSGTYTLDGTSTTTSFTSTGWRASETGYFRVTAVNSAGESPQSSTASATTQSSGGGGGGGGSAPSTPTGVTATAQSSSSISVSWSAVSGATSYDVYYEIGSSSTKNFAGNATGTSYTHSGLTASTTYYYYIKAKNSAGDSDYSSSCSATTQSSSGGGGGGGGTTEYRLDQPIFGTCSKSGNNLTINWSLTTSGKTPNGLYTYTSPSNIIIQVYDGTSFDNFQTLPASARSFTLNNYVLHQYSPAGASGDRVTIRVYCTSGSSAYDSRYATNTYFVGLNSWTPSY
jgi:hypothetical protein